MNIVLTVATTNYTCKSADF